MKTYFYRQNNSGGSFHEDEYLDTHVFIISDNEEYAEEYAEEIGIYFNGCENGLDCQCCGDRWSSPEVIEFPYRFGTYSLQEVQKLSKEYGVGFDKTTWRFMGTEEPDPERYDLIFNDVETFAEFMTDKRTGGYGYKIHNLPTQSQDK